MIAPWNELEPLGPTDCWLLEASAGTGKTYQITSIVLRLVAEYGVPLEEVLVVTFTNAATAELRHRLRQRLTQALEVVEGRTAGGLKDAVLEHVVQQVPPAELRRRLALALRSFDRAAVSTLHGFASRVLSEFAFDSGMEPGLSLLESEALIAGRLVDDALARLWHLAPPRLVALARDAGLGRSALRSLARQLSGTDTPVVVPPPDPHEPSTAMDDDPWRPFLQRFGPAVAARAQFVERFHRPEGALPPELEALIAAAESGAFRSLTAARVRESFERAMRPFRGGAASAAKLDLDLMTPLSAPCDLNQASLTELQQVGGLDAATAHVVIQTRPFRSAAAIRKRLPDAAGRVTYSKADHGQLHALFIAADWQGSGAVDAQPFWPLVEAYTALIEQAGAVRAELSRADAPFSLLAPVGRWLRRSIDAELERARALTFDRIISLLRERIAQTGGASSPLAQRLRQRFSAALVDEFQDTDAAQWAILQEVFLSQRRLFLIGDPKQAIYGFRGANINVYTAAAASVDPSRRRTMTINWRSDGTVLDALHQLWRPGSDAFEQRPDPDPELGENSIAEPAFDYIAVSPSPGRSGGDAPGLSLLWLAGDEVTKSKATAASAALTGLQREVLALLGGRSGLRDESGAPRALRPRDIAVLVSTHREAAQVRAALAAVGVPAVAASRDSVLVSPPARWLSLWLRAVDNPGDEGAARAAVTTPLFGWTAERLAWALEAAQLRVDVSPDRSGESADVGRAVVDADDPLGDESEVSLSKDSRLMDAMSLDSFDGSGSDATAAAAGAWEHWLRRLQWCARLWRRRGLVATLDSELQRDGGWGRLAAQPEGDRHATDLRHLLELLHARSGARTPSPGALADLLDAAGDDPEALALSGKATEPRLESDASAVTIETIHVSKGLEYPVVLLPFAWSASAPSDNGGPLRLQEPGGTLLDLSLGGTPARTAAWARASRDEAREGLRRLYVALTRGRHRTIVWCGLVGKERKRTDATPLGRLLWRGCPAEEAAAQGAALAASSGGHISWQDELGTRDAAPSSAIDIASVVIAAPPAPLPRERLQTPWATSSFTSLIHAVRGPGATDRDEKLELAEALFELPARRIAESTAPALDSPSEVRELLLEQTGRERLGAPIEASALSSTGAIESGFECEAGRPSPGLPRLQGSGGTSYGTWAHGIFEQLSFTTGQPRDGSSLKVLLHEGRGAGAVDAASRHEFAAVLPALLQTPLQTPSDWGDAAIGEGFALASIADADRMDELSFDLSLGAGTAWRADAAALMDGDGAGHMADRGLREVVAKLGRTAALHALIDVLERHSQTRGWPWTARLRTRWSSADAPWVGILTGSIDLVFRRRGPDGRWRFYVVDYKTNRIKSGLPGHYARDWLDWKMSESDYHLQSLLYTVALHRHLRLRLPGYDPELHLGGSLYLFLRGMAGEGTARHPHGTCLGVHAHRWAPSLVVAVDRVLADRLAGAPSTDTDWEVAS